jgi:hypothetical protein
MEENSKKSSQGRQFGVVLEHIDSKLDLVVEGHATLDKKIDDFKEEVDEKFKVVDYKFEVVLDGQKALDKKIDKNHEEFREFKKEVDYKFEVVLDELHIIRNELKEKIGRDEFVLLEKRVAALEKTGEKS